MQQEQCPEKARLSSHFAHVQYNLVRFFIVCQSLYIATSHSQRTANHPYFSLENFYLISEQLLLCIFVTLFSILLSILPSLCKLCIIYSSVDRAGPRQPQVVMLLSKKLLGLMTLLSRCRQTLARNLEFRDPCLRIVSPSFIVLQLTHFFCLVPTFPLHSLT